MDIHKTLAQAIDKKIRVLPEDKGKLLLARYGIKVPAGKRVTQWEEAEKFASREGYPLVTKALAPDLLHKSDRGAVKIGIENKTALRKAMKQLWSLFPGAPLLVEQRVTPGVELIAGLTHDAQFGPCLMIGVGGIFTEIYQDVDFLVLPVERHDVLRTLKGLKGYQLLTGFRGRPACDVEKVADALLGFAQFGMEAAPYYDTVDINPLVVNPHGIVALDVKIVLKSEVLPAPEVEPPPRTSYFKTFFAPKSVVVVGASGTRGNRATTSSRTSSPTSTQGISTLSTRGVESFSTDRSASLLPLCPRELISPSSSFLRKRRLRPFARWPRKELNMSFLRREGLPRSMITGPKFNKS